MKKDQNLPNKNILSNNSSRKSVPDNYNASRQQSPYIYNYREILPDQKKSRNFSQIRYIRSNSQNNQYRNNYSRSNSNRTNYSNYNGNCLNSKIRNWCYSNDRSRNSSYKRNRNFQTIGRDNLKIADHKTIQIRSNFNNYHNRSH